MKKPRKSSPKREKAIPLERPPYQSPYGSPETLEFLRNSEAREWIRRFRKKIGEQGAVNAQSWWAGVVSDIERIRGKAAADDLRYRMNKEREHEQSRTK